MEVITASVLEEDGDVVVLLSDACEEYNVPAAQAMDISVILQELTRTLTHSNYNPHSPITLVPSSRYRILSLISKLTSSSTGLAVIGCKSAGDQSSPIFVCELLNNASG